MSMVESGPIELTDINVGVLIMAGGEATRLPNKLMLDAGDEPLVVRVFNNVSRGRATYVSCKGGLPTEVDRALRCPMVVDRWSKRGPLAGLVSTMSVMPTRFVFAVAGDAPFVDSTFIERLWSLREDGDEAVVPFRVQDGKRRIEPLAALYDRYAFVEAGLDVLRGGDGALRYVLDRIRTRYVEITDERVFTNVNTPEDYARFKREIER